MFSLVEIKTEPETNDYQPETVEMNVVDRIKQEVETNDSQDLPPPQAVFIKTEADDSKSSSAISSENSDSTNDYQLTKSDALYLNAIKNETDPANEFDSNVVGVMLIDIKELKAELEEGNAEDERAASDNREQKTVDNDYTGVYNDIHTPLCSDTQKAAFDNITTYNNTQTYVNNGGHMIDNMVFEPDVFAPMNMRLMGYPQHSQTGHVEERILVIPAEGEKSESDVKIQENSTNGDTLASMKMQLMRYPQQSHTGDVEERILVIPAADQESESDAKIQANSTDGDTQECKKIVPKVFYTFRGIDEKQVETILGDSNEKGLKDLDKEVSSVDLRFGSHFLTNDKRRTNRFIYDEERKVYKCLHCTYETKGKSTYSAHFSRIHKVNQKVYQCPVCIYNTKERSHMMRHIKIKHDKHSKILYCSHCPYQTRDRNGLNQHFRMKHDIGNEDLKCQVCGYTTRSKASLTQHVKRQHEAPVEIIHCQFCNYKAKRHVDWLRHFRRKHDTESEIIKCHLCSFTTRQKLDLTSHMKRQHDSNVKYFPCDKCEFKAKSNADVIRHKKLKHDENVEYFRCVYCDYSSKLKAGLTAHCKRKHGLLSSSLKCPLCEFGTKDPTDLTKHFEAVHQNDTASVSEDGTGFE